MFISVFYLHRIVPVPSLSSRWQGRQYGNGPTALRFQREGGGIFRRLVNSDKYLLVLFIHTTSVLIFHNCYPFAGVHHDAALRARTSLYIYNHQANIKRYPLLSHK